MKITVDTNILMRAIVEDDPLQARIAQKELEAADLVAVTLPALCELVWVLSTYYKYTRPEISVAIIKLLEADNVVADRAAIDAGLAVLDGGGDFADGIIADNGKWLGAEAFVSFDKQAVKLLRARGEAARLLA